jgi:PAP2 superfamily
VVVQTPPSIAVSGEPQVSREARRVGRLSAGPVSRWRLMLLVACLATVPYQIAQRLAPSPYYRIEESAFDRLVGFNPSWVWVYLSLYLLVPIAMSLAPSTEIQRYVRGLLWMVAISCAAWLVWPIAGPRPVNQSDTSAVFAWLASVDRSINTVPSMHIELAVYSLLFAHRTWTRGRSSGMLIAAGWMWVGLIAYACLATKQHFAIDIVAGLAVAIVGDATAWRR